MDGLQFLLQKVKFGVAALEFLAEELFLDQFVSVAIDHGERELVRLRVALRTADIKHRRHVDELQVCQMTLHGLERCVLCSFIICHICEAALLRLLAFVVVLTHANHRFSGRVWCQFIAALCTTYAATCWALWQWACSIYKVPQDERSA